MSKAEWIDASIGEVIGNDSEFVTQLRSLLTASEEAAIFIRGLRKSSGLTQQELARRLGVSQPRVSAMEKGIGPDGPTYGMLRRIANACGIDWSLEEGLVSSPARAQRSSGVAEPLVAGAVGLVAGAIGMALLQTHRPEQNVEDSGGQALSRAADTAGREASLAGTDEAKLVEEEKVIREAARALPPAAAEGRHGRY